MKRHQGVKAITDSLIATGKVPVRVMWKNMVHYDEVAEELEHKIADALAENAKAFSAEEFLKALELINQMGDARMKACQIASMAAPYFHPKLSAMQIDVTRTDHPRDLRKDATIEEHRENFNKLRSMPLAPVLDNDTGAVVDMVTDEETDA